MLSRFEAMDMKTYWEGQIAKQVNVDIVTFRSCEQSLQQKKKNPKKQSHKEVAGFAMNYIAFYYIFT